MLPGYESLHRPESLHLPEGTKSQRTAGAYTPRAAEAQQVVPAVEPTGQHQEDAEADPATALGEDVQVPHGDGSSVASSRRSDKAMAFEAFRQESPIVAKYEKNRGLLRNRILEAKAVAQQVLH